MAKKASDRKRRTELRAKSGGLVWLATAGRMAPAGVLLDMSEHGIRFRHDPASTDGEGFPVAVPRLHTSVTMALTLRPADPLKAIQATPVRIEMGRDGRVEVACRFDAADAREVRDLHRKFVDVSLQDARKRLAAMQAQLLGYPSPRHRVRRRIGEVLVRRRVIEKKDLALFLEGNAAGIPLGGRLVEVGLITNRQLAEALSEHYGIPFVDLDAATVDPAAKRSIKVSTAKELAVLPFKTGSRRLHVACSHPLSLEEKRNLESESRKKVMDYLADPEQIRALLLGVSVRKRRRSKQRVATGVLARYRFYGTAMQQLDHRTFDGGVVNLSESGLLITGAVPKVVLDEFEKNKTPQLIMAVQIYHQRMDKQITLRFEPVRVLAIPGAHPTSSFETNDVQSGWVGARLSALVAEDQKNLNRLCKLLSGEITL